MKKQIEKANLDFQEAGAKTPIFFEEVTKKEDPIKEAIDEYFFYVSGLNISSEEKKALNKMYINGIRTFVKTIN